MITMHQIYERLVSSGLAQTDTIKGCTDAELFQISEMADLDLPNVYLEFMGIFGRSAGRFLRDVEIFYPAVLELMPIAEEILTDYEEYNIVLPPRAFVFAMRQKEQFMFFQDDSEDPPVGFYMSGDREISTISNSFTDVLESELTLAEENYRQIRGTPYE